MQRSAGLGATHRQVPPLVKPAADQSGMACLFLSALLALCAQGPVCKPAAMDGKVKLCSKQQTTARAHPQQGGATGKRRPRAASRRALRRASRPRGRPGSPPRGPPRPARSSRNACSPHRLVSTVDRGINVILTSKYFQVTQLISHVSIKHKNSEIKEKIKGCVFGDCI